MPKFEGPSLWLASIELLGRSWGYIAVLAFQISLLKQLLFLSWHNQFAAFDLNTIILLLTKGGCTGKLESKGHMVGGGNHFLKQV